ncbi:Fanconi anemia group M protein [Hyposmocoma kahamanoa]|uniref:Fanconi anemia group M protein n=1 Tax=Hyposmocoma kahamanoa TaxID=1477025 RepID=UPI000E6D8AC7|nr:Fanconi anemia group M protein [Hyposmocoma kahamanoa]
MSNNPSTSKENVVFEDDEIFEDSSILANFDNSSFRDKTSKAFENNVNNSLNKSGLNVSALCCDEEISGYDKVTGETWIYPTNYPVRDYQFNIIKSAILKNTLVSLPTGLGKTFIAAVIMYNFYRWYPLGKIIFTAPTRPLVAQQIDACYNIVAVPPNDTIEMTGHMQVNTRKTHWQTKRVFFATPQVIYNDIKSGICPADKIRCLVIDEAHRARGNYAYCQIVATLDDMGCKTYRVLALSATPGSKVDDVITVIKNLHIAHLELRTESCIDVAPYSHSRRINTVLVQLGPELSQLRQQYIEILDVYARRLKQMNILPYNLGNLSKGRIVMLYKEFQNKDRSARHPQHNYIMKDFTLLIALYHGLELLTKHGSRVFLNFFDEHPEKSWIQSDDRLTALLERLRDDLGINPLSLDRSILPDGTVPEIPKNLSFGHPKFNKLKEIMLDHFHKAKMNNQDTRAIVFCEYRESVNLVHCLLLQCRPLIVPQMFVGQGTAGKEGRVAASQKQQLRAMRAFRAGACTALVATCVAEEGLDVGAVDLIVCFDVATASPVRLVQRCGRTGRERSGQVYILVTEGREHQTLVECMRQRDGLNRKVLSSREVSASLFAHNRRLLPNGHEPKCHKMYITVHNAQAPKDTPTNNKKGQKDLRTMLLGRASSSSSNSSNNIDNLISEAEFNYVFPDGYRETDFLHSSNEYWAMNKETLISTSKVDYQNKLNLSTWLEWQRTLQSTVNIEHSKDTEILASLLQYSDAKRFDMPGPTFNTQNCATQNIVIASPVKAPMTSVSTKVSSPAKMSPAKAKQTKKKQKLPMIKPPGKHDGDIRALFSTATKSTKSYTKLISDLGIQNTGNLSTKLINLLVDLTINNTSEKDKSCYICDNICNCKIFQSARDVKTSTHVIKSFLSKPKLPDLKLIDQIDVESIRKYVKLNDDEMIRIMNTSDNAHDFVNDNVNYLDVDTKNCNKNFDLEFDFDTPNELNSPENLEIKKEGNKVEDKNFDLGDIEDIFADSSPEDGIAKDTTALKEKNSSDPKETLGFFGLDSIDDIFADSDENNFHLSPKTPNKEIDKSRYKNDSSRNGHLREQKVSPSILSGKGKDITSPILCSQARKFNLSTKKNKPSSSTPASNVKRRLISEANNNVELNQDRTEAKSSVQNNTMDTTNKSMLTITQLVDMINKPDDKSLVNISKIKQECQRSVSPILLTQADRKKTVKAIDVMNKNIVSQSIKTSVIILESDSDSDNNTQVYDVHDINVKSNSIQDDAIEINSEESPKIPGSSEVNKTPESSNKNVETKVEKVINQCDIDTIQLKSPPTNKRKISFQNDEINTSPYFNKKPKLDNETKKLSLKEKVLKALKSDKFNRNFRNDNDVHFVQSPEKIISQKENTDPQLHDEIIMTDKEDYVRKNNLEMLQMFRRDCKVRSQPNKRKLNFDDSDDDFIEGSSYHRSKTKRTDNQTENHRSKTTKNHKVRKKKHKPNGFIDLEAELSDDGGSVSGDELSDDSVGSIIDFICDDNVTHHEDMQAHYLRSVRSPVKPGTFKIPLLPKKYDHAEVFSQYVDEEDAYEMDSFCVDSHIGLTQANDVSELEVAEMLLEGRRDKKKRSQQANSKANNQNNESPLVRKKRNVKRIHSDSDDSS